MMRNAIVIGIVTSCCVGIGGALIGGAALAQAGSRVDPHAAPEQVRAPNAGSDAAGAAGAAEQGDRIDPSGSTPAPARAPQPQPQPPASVDDEVIVRGQTRADLRLQIEIAQDAVFARFNEINSSDDFDIHCRDEKPTGSHIPRRVCQANFWRDAQAEAGKETVRGLQGSSFAFDSQQFLAGALYRRTQLDEEMRRLVAEDEDLKDAVARLANLEQAESGGRLPSASLATASAEKAPGEDALPYDAALEEDVRMGRDPWTHTLRQHTFTIAHLYGQIRALEVKCPGRTQRLRFEIGAEWTLPDDWGTCTLRVDAPLGTTFVLYEFQ
jgi:hypothetical protein